MYFLFFTTIIFYQLDSPFLYNNKKIVHEKQLWNLLFTQTYSYPIPYLFPHEAWQVQMICPQKFIFPSPIYNQILEKTQFFFLETLNPLQKQSKKFKKKWDHHRLNMVMGHQRTIAVSVVTCTLFISVSTMLSILVPGAQPPSIFFFAFFFPFLEYPF